MYTYRFIHEGRVIGTTIAPDQKSASDKAAHKYGDAAAFIQVKRGEPFILPA